MRIAFFNDGFTVIEFLVASLILMVGLLGLLQSVNLALNSNLENEYRVEAANLVDEQMVSELSKGTSQAGFDAISTTTKNYFVERKIATGFKRYSVVKTGAQTTQNTKQITIQVSWRHRGQRYIHDSASLVSLSQ